MRNSLYLILFSCILFSCQPAKQDEVAAEEATAEMEIDMSQYPEVLQKAVTAHGGLDQWKEYAELTYTITWANQPGSENHIINLNNRKTLINRDTVQIGFNGEVVWVAPDLASFGGNSARFYHNLYFYFFGMPFLLTDPGINYEDLGEQTIEGEKYHALKVSYNDGVGDSPEDLYVAHFDPESYQLKLLLYTVTYFSGEKHTDYNALRYPTWTEQDGLLVPSEIKGHKYEEGKIGDLRYHVRFSDVRFSENPPEEHIFEKPEVAEIDSLKN